MKHKSLPVLLLAFSLSIASIAYAHSYKQGDIAIGHIWARATAKGQTTAAVYMPLLNNGKETDQLVAASSPVADKIEIHQSMNQNNIAHMDHMVSIMLEPGKPIALKPGGIHLMMFGVKQPFKEGDKFPLTLQFEKAGTANVEVYVAAAGAMHAE